MEHVSYGRGVEYVEPYQEIEEEEEEEIIIIGDDYDYDDGANSKNGKSTGGKSSGSDSKNKSSSTASQKKNKSLDSDSKNKSGSSLKSALKTNTFNTFNTHNTVNTFNTLNTLNTFNTLKISSSFNNNNNTEDADYLQLDASSNNHNDDDEDEECELLEDLDFTLLGDKKIVNHNGNNMDELIAFYKKDREFEYLQDDNTDSNNIRFLSWNILADGEGYALSSRHNYTTQRFRAWQYRSLRIYASIIAYDPDIVALQETTGKMYNEYIKPEFESIGYETLHSKKDRITTQSDTILFKRDRFKLIKYKNLNLGQLSDSFDMTVFGPINNMFRSFLATTNNYAQLTLFEDCSKSINNQFILCSGHLFWDPDRPQIKSAQMFILNEYLINLLCNDIEWRLNKHSDIKYDIDSNQDIINKIPIIFACDSNSVPCKLSCFGPDLITKSGVNEIMQNGHLNKHHLDHPISQYELRYLRSIQSDEYEHNPQIVQQQINMLQSVESWTLSCHFKWRSVYNEFHETVKTINNESILNEEDNESIFTTKVPEFCDTIDYIYCNEQIQIQSVLKMPYEKTPHHTSMNDDNFYDQGRYLQQRREDFEEFSRSYQLSMDQMISIRSRHLDKLLITGYWRELKIKEIPTNIVNIHCSYFCLDQELINLCKAHDEFIYDQSYWRMLYSSSGSKYQSDIVLNAWNYPFMPNRKDPSDHFALCCDLKINI